MNSQKTEIENLQGDQYTITTRIISLIAYPICFKGLISAASFLQILRKNGMIRLVVEL
jgi:hypothetical protein